MVGTRGPIGRPTLSRRSKILIGIGVALLLILLIGPRLVSIITDWMWYSDVGYSGVMSTMVWTRVVAFFVAALIVGGIVFVGVYAAYRGRPDFVPVSGPGDPLERYRAVAGRKPWITALIPAVLLGLIGGLVAQASWATIQMFINGESFGESDPQFGMDIGFYAFTLPFIRLILDLSFIALGVAFVGNLLTHYIFGGIRLGGGGRRGMVSRTARVQLAVIVGVFMLLKAVGYWLDRYDLLSSDRRGDIFTGGTYTDINVVMPSKLILMAIAIVCALAFFAAVFLRDLRIPAMATVLMLLSALVIGVIWPAAMEQFSVKPSAATKEADYIERNIQATTSAYRIRNGKDVQYESNWTRDPASPAAVNGDVSTLSNIRVLDPAVVSRSFVQRQSLRNFYGFPSQLAVDRYNVADDGGSQKQMRDFIVAARELDPSRFNEGQQNWINKHTVYTHGNGFIAAPANTVDAPPKDAASSDSGGLPKFYVSDLDTISKPDYKSAPIQVKQPRIYFGELISNVDPDYAIVGSENGEKSEYDQEGVRYTYSGDAGVSLGNFGSRLLYAVKYGERNFVLSDAINNKSRILYNRDPRDRVSKVAPWLKTDSKTYPAVMADGSIKWIVDGYTTLKNYPYAQRMALADATTDSRAQTAGQTGRTQADEDVSYVRNSVKATVDAYTGKVELYQFDEDDPVLKTWMKAFPGTVKPRSELNKKPDLLDHLRYPEDLFKLQRELLTMYHVSNPSDFYQANNFWSVPNDPTADDSNLPQPPYYFTAANPDGSGKPSFQLTSVTTPLRRQNLAAYITAASDPADYGKLTVTTTPTDSQTVGPRQVQEAMKNAVARDITLVAGSVNVIYGNLLTLPVGKNGVLYVQPLYTESKAGDSAMPKVFRMLTYYKAPDGQVEIGAAPTIGEALMQSGIDPRLATEPEAERPEGDDGTPAEPGSQTPSTPSPSDAPDDAAVAELRQAVEEMTAAENSGDLAKIGEALKNLKAALAKYPQAGS
ncbi:UPF0182 family protein [Gordonia sp. (in: high G+C Gram-positive bacteria)]|uniref:UPF0182 family protein n=1 Tax=Gordonia sp. (in: high G+C Gram-positive bacteria) TaxID=84139 RepID=UPI003F9CA067